MANKRIKDLSTTAAVTASDDFIAVDGATNGTRKLDAYNPTFGGNLTVSGGTITGGTSGMSLASGGTNQNITLTPSGTGATVISKSEANTNAITTALNYIKIQNTSLGGTYIGALEFYTWDNRRAAGIFANRNNVDGTSGILSFAYSTSVNSFAEGFRLNSTGNLLLGTTTDSGQKLQVNGSAKIGSTSWEEFGTNGTAQFYAASGGTAALTLTSAGYYDWRIRGGSTSMTIVRDNTDMLSFDSSSNATFAGTIKPQQAATASAPTYVKGAIYFDTTLNKLRVGGASGWETITSV